MRRHIFARIDGRMIISLALTIAIAASSAAAQGQGLPSDVYRYDQVNQPASMLPGMKPPVYPSLLRAAHVTGRVVVGFVVDTLGRVESTPFHVYRSTHELFTQAVRACLPKLRFAPAVRGGQRVRQLVIGEFTFPLDTSRGR